MNWLLILVIIVIGGLAYRGYKKGLIRMVLSLATIILSVIITGVLGPVVSKSLCDSEVVLNYVSDGVNQGLGIEKSMSDMSEQMAAGIRGEDNTIKIGEKDRKSFISGLDLPDLLSDSLLDGTADLIQETGQVTAHTFSDYVCDMLAKIIIRTLTYVIIFFIARIILKILVTAFNVVDKIPIVEDASELVGCFIGAGTGLIVVWVGFMILVAFSSTDFGIQCYRCINESPVLAFLYNNNLLLKWILSAVANN